MHDDIFNNYEFYFIFSIYINLLRFFFIVCVCWCLLMYVFQVIFMFWFWNAFYFCAERLRLKILNRNCRKAKIQKKNCETLNALNRFMFGVLKGDFDSKSVHFSCCHCFNISENDWIELEHTVTNRIFAIGYQHHPIHLICVVECVFTGFYLFFSWNANIEHIHFSICSSIQTIFCMTHETNENKTIRSFDLISMYFCLSCTKREFNARKHFISIL